MIITRGFGQGQWIIARGLNYYKILSIVVLASFIRLKLELASKLSISDIVLEAKIKEVEHGESAIDTVVQIGSKIGTEIRLKSKIHKEISLWSEIKK